MFPEISARRSLLEPSFRYLSPGIEGEKRRPLDRMWQIPFIHSVQFLITSHFYNYIYESVTGYFFHVVRKSASLHNRYLTIALVPFKHTLPKVKNDYSRHFDFHTLRARSNWHKIHGIFVYAFAEQTKFFIISEFILNFCRLVVSQAKVLKKRLHGAKKSGFTVVFGVFLVLQSPSPKLTILLYYSLCNMAIFANFQNFVIFEYYLFFFQPFLHATSLII